jgi:hypothetical protein
MAVKTTGRVWRALDRRHFDDMQKRAVCERRRLGAR